MDFILYKLSIGVIIAGMLWLIHYLGKQPVGQQEHTEEERKAA